MLNTNEISYDPNSGKQNLRNYKKSLTGSGTSRLLSINSNNDLHDQLNLGNLYENAFSETDTKKTTSVKKDLSRMYPQDELFNSKIILLIIKFYKYCISEFEIKID